MEIFYEFFYSIYKVMRFIVELFGLTSFFHYLNFSGNFIPKLNFFISE
jgi:hypothetical protein